MSYETINEFLEDYYSFLNCKNGYWKSANGIIKMNGMDKEYLIKCIAMVERWNPQPLPENQYNLEIENRLKTKLTELKNELSKYK